MWTIFSKNGLTFNGPSQSEFDDNKKFIVNGHYTWWVEEGLKFINESYGCNFIFTDQLSETVKTIHVYFTNLENESSFAFVRPNYYPSTNQTYALKLVINMNYADKITEGNTDGKFAVSDGSTICFDRTLANEFTHAFMSASKLYAEQIIGLSQKKRG